MKKRNLGESTVTVNEFPSEQNVNSTHKEAADVPAQKKRTNKQHAFEQWCKECKAGASRVEIRDGKHGTGLFATEKIEAGTAYCSISSKMQLTCDIALVSPIGRAILRSRQCAECTKGPVSARAVLYCYIIAAAANETSFWYPWLSVCPSVYTDPLWWDRKDCIENTERQTTMIIDKAARYLAGTQASYHLRFQHRRLLDMWNELDIPSLNKSFPDLFPKELFTLDRFLWARSFFSSRCYHIDALRQQLKPNGKAKADTNKVI